MSIEEYARVAVRILAQDRYQRLFANTHPGELGCTACGHVAPSAEFVKHPANA